MDEIRAKAIQRLERVGCDAISVPVSVRADSFNDTCVSAVEAAAFTYLQGGNPAYIAAALQGTPLWEAVRHKPLLATSGGTTAIGCRAPTMRDPDEPLHWQEGLGLLEITVIAPHWDSVEGIKPGVQKSFKEAADGRFLVTIDDNTCLCATASGWTVSGEGAVTVTTPDNARESFGDGEVATLLPGAFG